MTIAAAKGYDVTIVETKADKSKHSMIKFDTYALHKKDYTLHVGNYSNLITLHKKLKTMKFLFSRNLVFHFTCHLMPRKTLRFKVL